MCQRSPLSFEGEPLELKLLSDSLPSFLSPLLALVGDGASASSPALTKVGAVLLGRFLVSIVSCISGPAPSLILSSSESEENPLLLLLLSPSRASLNTDFFFFQQLWHADEVLPHVKVLAEHR